MKKRPITKNLTLFNLERNKVKELVNDMSKKLSDVLKSKAPVSADRSPQWTKVRKQFLKDNPEYKQIILQAPPLGDPTKLSSTRKFDTGFGEVLQKIHERTPGSQLDKTSSQL